MRKVRGAVRCCINGPQSKHGGGGEDGGTGIRETVAETCIMWLRSKELVEIS